MAVCPITIALGVMGAVVLVRSLVSRRRFRRHGPWAFAACGPGLGHGFAGFGHGGGCGSGAHGDADESRPRWSRRRHRSIGRSFWLRAVFSRLDTTPGQEREIRAALEELQKATWEARSGVMGAREDLASAIRGESFDEVTFAAAEGRADATIAQAKAAFATALKRIHAVLDAHQRERLAEILVEGPGSFRGGARSAYRD